ncbi:MAG: amidohydrolase family protein [Anaerolineae bacterium]
MTEQVAPLLIEHGTLLSFEGGRLTEQVGWVAVEGERIAAVGAGEAPAAWRERAGRVINARHMAVLPGLVNGHTHLSQTFLRGLADDRPLLRWLKEVMWPAQAAMTPEDMYLAAKLGLVENLRCGVTEVVQHHKLPGREHVDAACRAAAEVGIRMTLARGWVDLGPSGEPLDHILAEMRWLYETWHTEADGGRRTQYLPSNSQSAIRNPQSKISLASGPLAPWRCSDDAMRELTALARSWGVPTHIHVAEAQDEVEMMLARCGKRHIEWLADLGCLGPDTQLVHAVHVTDAELDLIVASGAMVVHCPTSNMYLASGAAPVRKMLDRGIPVRLGTDGSGSNNSQDLLECAKIAALLAKHATGDAQALLPGDVVRMMTRGHGDAGTGGRRDLAVGSLADITIVDLNNPRCQPVHSAASALVYNAGGADVHTVIVGGEILLDAGRATMLDEDALMAQCRDAAAALMARAGICVGT